MNKDRLRLGTKIKITRVPKTTYSDHYSKVGDIGTLCQSNMFHNGDDLYDVDGHLWYLVTNRRDKLTKYCIGPGIEFRVLRY